MIDFENRVLYVATNPAFPYLILDYVTKNNTWVFIGGLEAELLKAMSSHFNFNYKIINCIGRWGTKLPNNTWTGVIGEIASKSNSIQFSKKADIGFGQISVTHQRLEAVHFLNPHVITSASFITSPPKLEPIITLVIKPFDFSVWICFILSLILMLLNIWVISEYCILSKKIGIKWAIISVSLRQQLSCTLPSFIPLRIIFCCWLLSCLVLTSSYSGCLYSLMAFPSKMKTINTIEELSIAQTNGEIQVTAIGAGLYYQSLKKGNSGVHQELGKYLKPVKNMKIGLDLVKKSTQAHAFIMTRDLIEDEVLIYGEKSFYSPKNREESTLRLDMIAFAVQKEFKYEKEFNNFISDIKKGGFLEYWRNIENKKRVKFERKVINSDQTIENHYQSLNLNQLRSTVYLFVTGIIISLFILSIEIIYLYIKHIQSIRKRL